MLDPSTIGSLKYLYLDELIASEGTDAPDFVIRATAQLLRQSGGRNWLPVVVQPIDRDRYQVIGNTFVYAVAKEAKLERVWCVIADTSEGAVPLARALAREDVPRINLATATREELSAALKYLKALPHSPLKMLNTTSAINRIHDAPRQSWTTFTPITSLRCGITKGEKLDVLKTVFYLSPVGTPLPVESASQDDPSNQGQPLEQMTLAQLKEQAKALGIFGFSKLRKDELVVKICRKQQHRAAPLLE
ncbi:MAG: Rho termination factor [Oscillatoriales cyanobacterium SM2_2_1]|nr:Rho termination factor [Oscillatoriales cyanobacterium SM2_2_1]